jgi:nucleoside-diphosphate-sugar epimerase
MRASRRILVTGATGKVGEHLLARLLSDPRFDDCVVRALCHNRVPNDQPRLEIARGSISSRESVELAMRDVTHVVHLATCKELPELIMDVTVKGLFWLLEASRQSPTFEQFVLLGGDAAVGHCYFPKPLPVTEAQPHTAYPGCYALSKVLEEVMLEQYYCQYDLSGCCLRAPWIMEKDDFKCHLSFAADQFGAPRFRELVGAKLADEYERTNTVPIALDIDGNPLQRGFVHVDDVVAALVSALDHPKARQQTFNVTMDEPLDYRKVAAHLAKTRGYPSVALGTQNHSTWLDNSKAKLLLGWRPSYDYRRLVDTGFDYERSPSDPRVTWYPS